MIVFFSQFISDLQTKNDSLSAAHVTLSEKVIEAIADKNAKKQLFDEAEADLKKPREDYNEAMHLLNIEEEKLQIFKNTEKVLTEDNLDNPPINAEPFITQLEPILNSSKNR